MAATFVASTAVGNANPTMPAGTVSGDYVCVAAYRNAGTAPTLPAGWILVTKSDTNPAHLVAKREYDGAWTMPTFTNANRCVAITVRAAAGKEIEVGNVLSEARSNANPNWSALTLQKPDGTGLILRGLAHTRPDASPPTPANHTLIDSNGTQPGYGTYRKNSSTDAAAASITISRSTTYTVFTVEVKEVDFAGGTVALTDGRDTLGSTATSIPPISVTQAAYRFYGAGSETGSAPRANQNTPPTGNLDLGDAFGTIRVLMQSNAGSIFPSTDDWTMQWEKNANGSWRDVLVPPTLIHMYDASNVDSANQLGTTTSPEVGQTFLGRGATITKAGFYINRIGTPSAGNITCAIYPMTGGVLGTNGVPSNPPTALAVSTTSIAASSVSTSLGWVDFDFSPFTTVSDVPYVVVLRCPNVGNTSNCIQVAGDSTSPTHVGNSTTRQQNGNWNTNSAFDFVFRIYGDDAVVPWDDPALTDGQATTNRLTGGTGTFVPGQVTEDGIIDNLGITADNFTELAFSVRIKASAFTQGDQLRFRVLRNGAPDVITYTQVPLANVTKTVAPQTVTLAQTDGLDTMSGAAGAPQVTVRLQTSGASCGFHRGTNTGDINGTPTGWVVTALDSALTFTRVASAPGVAGPAKIQLRDSTTSTAVEYVTLPLAEAITINSPIDFSIWALQSAAVNIALNAKVDKVSPTGVLTEIGRSNNTVDLPINAAGNAANSSEVTFSCPVTTTDFAPGDRFRITFFGQDSAAGTMTAGGSVLMFSGGADETVNGSQTSITFNNPVVFNKTVPTGTQLFFTSTAGPNVGADTELEMWTSRGTAAVSSFRAAASAGWAAPEQHQLASVNLEWYSKQLNPVTLDGFIRVRFSGSCGNTSNHTSPRFQVAVCDNDGSNAVIWVDHCGISGQPNGVTSFPNGELNPATSNTDFYVQGNPLAIAPGQRLRFRTFLDDTALTPRALGGSITFRYAATSANSDGDAYLVLPQTVTEFTGATPSSDGTLAVADRPDFLISTVFVDAIADLDQTDGTDEIVAIGNVPPSTATLALTDGRDTLVGVADFTPAPITITLALTDGPDTMVATATTTIPTFTGTLALTDTRDFAAMSGQHTAPIFTATAAFTDGTDTMVATVTAATPTHTGTFVVADGLDTLVAAGSTTVPTFTSTLALTDGVDTIVATIASGTLHTGTVAQTDGIDTLVASAQATAPAFTSTVAQTDGIDTLVAAVSTTAPTFTSTLVKTDGIDTLVASVSTTAPTFTGTLALADGLDTLVASGSTTVPTFTSTLALTDGADTLVASATAGVVGAAILAITDGTDTMVATANTVVPTFSSTLSISDRVDTIVTSLSLTVPLFVSTASQTDGVDSIVTAVNAIPPPNPSTLSLSDGLDTLTAFVSAGAVGAAVLALADGPDTITAAGTTTAPTFAASLALTDGVDTLLSVPTAVVPTQTSTLSVSDGPDALAALVATTAPTYTGSVAVTDGIDTMVAAASTVTPTTTSNLVVTDGPDTILVTGTTVAPTFTSTLALTEGADAIVATGTHAAPGNSAGALTITDGQDTIVAAATATIPTLLGTFVVADGTDTLAAVIAFVAINDPTLAVTDRADTIVASASATVPLLLSTFAATDSPDTLAGIGSTVPPTITGSMAATETPDLLSAVGTSAAPGNSAGALTISDGLDTLVASATRTIPTVTATVAVSDGVDTLEATPQSIPINSVALAQSDGLDTIVTSTSLTVPLLVGFIIITDGTDTMVGVLTSVVPTFTSTLGFIDGADTIDAFATAAVPLATSTLTFTDNRDTVVAAASATPPTHTGTIDFTDGRDTIVTSVVAGAVGAAVLVISDGLDTMVAVANTVVPTFTSTATGTDGRDSLEVSIATIPPTHSSTLALTDGVDALVAPAVSTPPIFTATLILTDGQDTLVTSVNHIVPTFTGNTVTTDGRDTFVAVGLHAPPGNSAGGFGATDGRDTMVAVALCLFGHTILNGYKLEMRRLDLLRACTRVDEEREIERTDKPTVIRPAASEKGILIP
jgi:hypothetical protein